MALEHLYRGVVETEAVGEGLAMLADAMNAQASFIFEMQYDGRSFPFYHRGGIDPAMWDEFEAHYVHLDPRIDWCERHPDFSIFHDGLIADEVDMDRHPYFEFLRRYDLHYSITARTVRPTRRLSIISLQRSPGLWFFSPEEIAAMEMIRPHLDNFLALRRRLITDTVVSAGLVHHLETERTALALVDASGTVVYATAPLRAFAERGDALFLRGGRLLAAHRDCEPVLRQAIEAAVSPVSHPDWAPRSVVLKRKGRELPLLARVCPYRVTDEPVSCAAVVVVVDPEREVVVDGAELQSVYGLTRAEAALAIAIAEGRSPAQVAAETGRSIGTVRFQLKQVFQRMGISAQRQLVDRVRRLFR